MERAGDDGCDELRRLYAKLFRDFFEDGEGRTAQISSGAIQLAGQLRDRFSVKAEHLTAGQRTALRTDAGTVSNGAPADDKTA